MIKVFQVSGAVFIMNSKIHWRKISLKAYFKAILRHFGLNSTSGSTADGCTELKPVFDLISRSHRSAGKNQFIVGLPRCNMNSKVQILGKSKVLKVKTEVKRAFE